MNNTENPNESLNQIIGKRIRNVIKLKGLTQKEVAEQIFYQENSFSEMLSGKKGISKENLVKLSEILGCSTDYFLGLNDFPSKNPLVPDIADYTGLTDFAIESLHMYKNADPYKKYKNIPVPDPRFPDYTIEQLKEEYGDDKLFVSLVEPKSILWLSAFIALNSTCLKMENTFISYKIECIRKTAFDVAQKELLSELNKDNHASDEKNQLYNQVILHQENSASHLAILKESVLNDFSDFCDLYFAALESDAVEIYLENTKKRVNSDK